MKATILAIGLIILLFLGSGVATAQVYGSYPYAPYYDTVPYQAYPYPQQYDPYYDLHVMHYQLYLPQYPVYQPFYQPCCFVAGFPVGSAPVAPIVRPPRPPAAPRPLPLRPR